MKFFLFTSIFAWQFYLQANTCEEFDLRSPGQSFHKVPVFNQGSSEYCWGFAGSGLTSHQLHSSANNPNQLRNNSWVVSPTVTTNSTTSKEKLCPTPCAILESVKEDKSACDFTNSKIRNTKGHLYNVDTGEVVPNQNECSRPQNPYTISNFEDSMSKIRQKLMAQYKTIDIQTYANLTQPYLENPYFKKRKISFTNFLNSKNGRIKLGELNNYSMAPGCYNFSKPENPFIGSPQINFLANDENFQNSKCEDVLSELATQLLIQESPNCLSKLKKLKLAKEDIWSKLETTLRNNIKPIVIHYCPNFLFSGKQNEPVAGVLCPNDKGQPSMDHKSLLIGRRFNSQSKKCEYLLRNSWGNNCDFLSKKFKSSCQSELSKKGVADTWISSEDLKPSVHGVSFVD